MGKVHSTVRELIANRGKQFVISGLQYVTGDEETGGKFIGLALKEFRVEPFFDVPHPIEHRTRIVCPVNLKHFGMQYHVAKLVGQTEANPRVHTLVTRILQIEVHATQIGRNTGFHTSFATQIGDGYNIHTVTFQNQINIHGKRAARPVKAAGVIGLSLN